MYFSPHRSTKTVYFLPIVLSLFWGIGLEETSSVLAQELQNPPYTLQDILPIPPVFTPKKPPVFTPKPSSPPLFENIILSPESFRDPTIIRGISGGEQTARSIADQVETPTGPCVGFVDQAPDHILNLTHFFDYLNIQIESSDDTTLVIKGPGGTWCNDDAINDNPAIAGQWLQGSYEIWVGSYKKDKYHPYIINITQMDPLADRNQ